LISVSTASWMRGGSWWAGWPGLVRARVRGGAPPWAAPAGARASRAWAAGSKTGSIGSWRRKTTGANPGNSRPAHQRLSGSLPHLRIPIGPFPGRPAALAPGRKARTGLASRQRSPGAAGDNPWRPFPFGYPPFCPPGPAPLPRSGPMATRPAPTTGLTPKTSACPAGSGLPSAGNQSWAGRRRVRLPQPDRGPCPAPPGAAAEVFRAAWPRRCLS